MTVEDDEPDGAAGSMPEARRGLPQWGERPGIGSQFVAFMFADIRGYTAYTGAHGADAAAHLAGVFAGLADEAVTDHGGLVVGTWGDEVLAEFASARAAVLAALELQARCQAWTVANPGTPLAAGIGLDVGEPVAAEESRASEALNLAARLCSAAAAGQVLASRELMHLTGHLHGKVATSTRRLKLKGIHGRTEVLVVRPLQPDTALERKFRAVLRSQPAARRQRRERVATASALAAALVFGGTAWWLGHPTARSGLSALPPNSVGLIQTDGSLHAAVPVGQGPTAITSAAGSLWVANGGANTVMRIDPRAHIVVREVTVGADPVAIAATGSDVWVVNAADGTVDRINTNVNQVVGKPIKVGNQPSAIAAGPSGVWVANTGDDTVQRIDPGSDQPDPAIAVGGGPDGVLAAQAGSIWVANGVDGTVSHLDVRTGTVRTPIRVGAGPTGLTFVDGAVWVTNSLEQSVSRIDPQSGAVDTIRDVGDGPTTAAGDGRYLWVAASHSATVARVEPSTGNVRRFDVGASPTAITTIGSSVYVASRAFAAASHVGGTLTAGVDWLPGTLHGIDPANQYYYWTAAAERFVYDGLMAYRAADGAAGYTLVPDLAARMPDVSQDGTTYTFSVRQGIRYSTGIIVRPQDFVRGFRRVFTVDRSGNPALLSGVVGAKRCIASPAACDLSRGVSADDAHHRVTIHLVAPDSDFLYKLAYFVVPAPPGTSPKQLTTPLPATGPYQIKAAFPRPNPVDHHREVVFDTLIRNQYFRPWSFAAQPPGYPDVIRFREYRDAGKAADAVQTGAVDIVRMTDSDTVKLAHVVAELRLRYPDRLHAVTIPFKWFEWLNTQVPPFNNRLARQAVNYAVDRVQAGRDVFGRGLGQSSCQMLPPNFPSFQWYCPYTKAGPKPYNGPDLAEARRLVKQSGTSGASVKVYGFIDGPADRALLAHLAQALRNIGYKASTRTVRYNDAGYTFVSDPRHGVQMWGKDGWIADYPSADTFYDTLNSCRVKNQGSGFCDKYIDHLAAVARTTALTDPSKARRLWKTTDKLVTDAAPWVTLGIGRSFEFTSSRVGNFQSPPYIPLYDQLWVK